MDITQRQVNNATILDLKGDLTYANRGEFKSAVERVKTTGCRHLILNMEQVRFVDSSGLGLLVLLSQHFKVNQSQLSLVKPQNYVREIMSLANIPMMIPLYESEEEALAGRVQSAA